MPPCLLFRPTLERHGPAFAADSASFARMPMVMTLLPIAIVVALAVGTVLSKLDAKLRIEIGAVTVKH